MTPNLESPASSGKQGLIRPFLQDPVMAKLLVAGLLFHLVAAWMSTGFYYFDEHFQILEFAGLKLGFNQPADLAWEYAERMRASLQPGIAYLVISGLEGIGVTDPFAQTRVLRFLSAIFSYVTVLLLVREQLGRTQSLRAARWMLGLSLLLWFVPYFNVRFSSETWSAAFMTLGLVLVMRSRDQGLAPSQALLVGVFFGLAFLFRYQIAFMILGVLGWLLLVARQRLKPLLLIGLGGLAAVALGVLLDWWFYGDWVLAPWNYVHANLIEGKAASFGTLPWWGYFKLLVEPPRWFFGALILLTFLGYFVLFPKSILTWASVPFLLVHMAIGHKELRFLLPLVNFTGIFFVLSISELCRKGVPGLRPGIARDRLLKWSRVAFLAINIPALVFMSIRPATFALAPLLDLLEIKGDDRLVMLYPKGQQNPLGDRVKLNFYMPADLIEQPLDRIEDLEGQVDDEAKYVLFVLYKRHETIAPIALNSVRCDIVKRPPDWAVEHMNFGDWVGRFGIGVFYLCHPTNPEPGSETPTGMTYRTPGIRIALPGDGDPQRSRLLNEV
jgi:phosphatidylinositol glycan class B